MSGFWTPYLPNEMEYMYTALGRYTCIISACMRHLKFSWLAQRYLFYGQRVYEFLDTLSICLAFWNCLCFSQTHWVWISKLCSLLSELHEAFVLFDKNKDGVISKEELGAVLFALGQRPTVTEIQGLIRSVDLDSKLSTLEFAVLL